MRLDFKDASDHLGTSSRLSGTDNFGKESFSPTHLFVISITVMSREDFPDGSFVNTVKFEKIEFEALGLRGERGDEIVRFTCSAEMPCKSLPIGSRKSIPITFFSDSRIKGLRRLSVGAGKDKSMPMLRRRSM